MALCGGRKQYTLNCQDCNRKILHDSEIAALRISAGDLKTGWRFT